MLRIAAKFVRRLLTADQRQERVEVCEDLLQRVQEDPHDVKADHDESWIFVSAAVFPSFTQNLMFELCSIFRSIVSIAGRRPEGVTQTRVAQD